MLIARRVGARLHLDQRYGRSRERDFTGRLSMPVRSPKTPAARQVEAERAGQSAPAPKDRRTTVAALMVAIVVVSVVVALIALVLPGSGAESTTAEVQGVTFEVTSVQIADRWGLNEPAKPDNVFLVVSFDCAGAGTSVDPFDIAAAAYVTDSSSVKTAYAILDPRSEWPAGPLSEGETRSGTWAFEVPQGAKGFVLHLGPDGPAVDLDSLLTE
jgi:hypothetical protein